MKQTSNILIVTLATIIVAGLCLEGIYSITSKHTLESRLQMIEQTQKELIEKQTQLQDAASNAAPSVNSAIRVEQTNRTVSHEELDFFCLAKNIFHEAGVEDELGMFAVAQVTINRVRHSNFPDTICDVVMQPSQFSWTNNRDRKWSHPEGPKWAMAKRIAQQVIKEGYRVPALQTAMFYHADYAKPNWRNSRAIVAHLGSHIFYASAR